MQQDNDNSPAYKQAAAATCHEVKWSAPEVWSSVMDNADEALVVVVCMFFG